MKKKINPFPLIKKKMEKKCYFKDCNGKAIIPITETETKKEIWICEDCDLKIEWEK